MIPTEYDVLFIPPFRFLILNVIMTYWCLLNHRSCGKALVPSSTTLTFRSVISFVWQEPRRLRHPPTVHVSLINYCILRNLFFEHTYIFSCYFCDDIKQVLLVGAFGLMESGLIQLLTSKWFMLKRTWTFLFTAKKSDRAARALRLRKRRDGGGGEDSSKVLKVNFIEICTNISQNIADKYKDTLVVASISITFSLVTVLAALHCRTRIRIPTPGMDIHPKNGYSSNLGFGSES